MFDHDPEKLGAVQVSVQDFNCYDRFGVCVARKVVKGTFKVVKYEPVPADELKASYALEAIDSPQHKEELIRLYGLTEADLAAAQERRNEYNLVLRQIMERHHAK